MITIVRDTNVTPGTLQAESSDNSSFLYASWVNVSFGSQINIQRYVRFKYLFNTSNVRTGYIDKIKIVENVTESVEVMPPLVYTDGRMIYLSVNEKSQTRNTITYGYDPKNGWMLSRSEGYDVFVNYGRKMYLVQSKSTDNNFYIYEQINDSDIITQENGSFMTKAFVVPSQDNIVRWLKVVYNANNGIIKATAYVRGTSDTMQDYVKECSWNLMGDNQVRTSKLYVEGIVKGARIVMKFEFQPVGIQKQTVYGAEVYYQESEELENEPQTQPT